MDKAQASLDMLQHLTEDRDFECRTAPEAAPLHLTRGAVLSRGTISGDGRT